jgi:hypothetical protein
VLSHTKLALCPEVVNFSVFWAVLPDPGSIRRPVGQRSLYWASTAKLLIIMSLIKPSNTGAARVAVKTLLAVLTDTKVIFTLAEGAIAIVVSVSRSIVVVCPEDTFPPIKFPVIIKSPETVVFPTERGAGVPVITPAVLVVFVRNTKDCADASNPENPVFIPVPSK